MATILPKGETRDKTYTASGDLSARQFHIVTLAAASTVAIAPAAAKCHGVLKNKSLDGGQASVVTFGETPVAVDATTAILIGDRIVAGANGVGVKIAATAATRCEYLGTALEALAAGAGTIIVDVAPGVVTNPA